MPQSGGAPILLQTADCWLAEAGDQIQGELGSFFGFEKRTYRG